MLRSSLGAAYCVDYGAGMVLDSARTPVRSRRVTTTTVTVISKTRHHLLSSHHIDADRNYWPNQQKTPTKGRGNL